MADERVEIELLAKDFASKVFERLGGTAEKQGKRTERSLTGMDKAAGRLTGSLKRTAAAFVGIGAAALAVRRGTRDFLAFNKAIAEVSTILDEDQIALTAVEEKVKDLSLALGENETLIARGFYQTLSAGVTEASDAFLVLEEATKLAVAGVASTEQSVDAITTVLNAYGFAAEHAGQVSDSLFKTVELGKTRISELSASLGQVVPIASELGLTFEQVLAATAAMTKQGAPTAEAMTRVRAVIIALLKNAEGVDKVLRSVGGSFDVNTIRAKGLLPVLLQLRQAFAGNEDELTKFLGRAEATTAVLALTRAGGQDFVDILGDIENAAGATGDALEKQLAQPAARTAILLAGVRQGFADLAGEGLIRPLLDAADAFGSAEDAARALRETIGSIGPVLRTLLGLTGAFAEGVAAVTFPLLKLADAIGAIDVADEEFEKIFDSMIVLGELTRNLITGQEDFSAATAIHSKRRRAALVEEQAFVRSFAEFTAGQLKAAFDVGDATLDIGAGANLEQVQAELDEFVARAGAAGVAISKEFERAFRGSDLDITDLILALRELGLELELTGETADQLESIRAQAARLRQEFEEFPRPLAEENAQIEKLRDLLAAVVADARAAGKAIDTAFIRELAFPLLRIDPDELIASLDLAQDAALQKFEQFGRKAQAALEATGIDLGSALFVEEETGVLDQRLSGIRARLGEELIDLARIAAEAGATIPAELLDPLAAALLRPEFRDTFREELAGLVADATGEGEAIAAALRQIDLADVVAALKEAKAEAQVVAAEVAGGLTPQLALLSEAANLARLEFQRMGIAGELGEEQVERAIAAVNAQLAKQAQAAKGSGEALGVGLGGALAGFTALAARAAEIANVFGPIVDSEARIAEIVEDTLGPFERQRQSIEDQAAAWRQLAEDRLAATDPAQLAREQAAIDRTTGALLGQVDAEERVARASAEAQVVAIEAEAGLKSRADAAEAATDAEIAHFEALGRSSGLTEAQIKRAVAALRLLTDVERELAIVQNERQVVALEASAGILSAADAEVAAINAEVEVMRALLEAGLLTADQFARVVAAADAARDAATTFMGAFRADLRALQDELSAASLGHVAFGELTSAIDSASRALVDSETTFSEWRDAVIQDLAAVAIKILLTKAALLALGALGINAEVSIGTGAATLGVSAVLLDRAGEKTIEGGAAITAAAAALFAAANAAAAVEFGSSIAFAEGGVMPGRMLGMAPLPVKRYAFGGIADSPQVGIFGEGQGAEAFVPLGGDRKIPVRIETNQGQGQGGGDGDARQQNIDARFEINVSSLDAEGSASAVRRIMPEVLEQFSTAVQGGRMRGSRAAIDSIRFATRDRGGG